MRRAASNSWISLSNERNDWFVVDHGALMQCKPSCGRSQYPRTVLFVGHEAKTRALRAIFPFNNHNRRKRDSFTNLVCDALTSESERPILFSELNLVRPPNSKVGFPDGCKKYRLQWVDEAEQRMTADEVYDTLIAQVILPFYDVVCLFADDFRNHEHVALHVTRWAQKARPSTVHSKPRFVIFSSSPFNLDQLPAHLSLFSHVRANIQLQSKELSYTAQYLRLRDTVLTELDKMQETKSDNRLQFELRHMAALVDKSLEHFSFGAPFDPARAAKEFNPLEEEFSSHLAEVIRVQGIQSEVTEVMVVKLIASAIMLDAYPFGTHSGLIVLLLFLGRKTTNFCISTFDVLARRIFSRRLEHRRTMSSRIANLFAFCLRDSIHDVEQLKDCLQETYGTTKKLFGSRDSPLSGAKVAVTATTVRSSSLCIFSNYNGLGKRKDDCAWTDRTQVTTTSGLWRLRKRSPFATRLKRLRQHLRKCFTVPFGPKSSRNLTGLRIFPMKYIDGIGCHVQDGGVGKHNNPVSTAFSEVRMIWDTGVDVLLSIGTGYVPENNALTDSRRRILDTSIPRCFRSWESSRNGQRIWDDFCRHLGHEERESYFRINVPLDRAPDLDAVESMPEIRAAGVRFLEGVDIQSIRRSLLSSAFFFELDELPIAQGATLECRGSIRCRSPNSRALIEGIISDFPYALFQNQSHETLAFVRDAVRCQECRLYRIGVKFRVESLDQAVVLRLKFNDQFSSKVSGFPNSMSWFAGRQGLYSPFGRADHQPSLRDCDCSTNKTYQRKRRASTQLAALWRNTRWGS
ncbi:hypothetical protein B0J12DRAFT_571025 [Macrophomina phaseolina]|uniref:Patatin/Phospholipase A2-related protein n=1 Tax=Macrophomina phaseolina TaxID=35725 RepID=A0ABQ8GF76_9PEZI|nr:hypothetical protein B0J12DRAFT_571025 [Macrophomina phaseolina]